MKVVIRSLWKLRKCLSGDITLLRVTISRIVPLSDPEKQGHFVLSSSVLRKYLIFTLTANT